MNLDELEAKAKLATKGPWSVWTSNSVRRITSDANSMHRDGGVLSAVSTRDGLPDLHGDNRDHDLSYIAACSPDVVLRLIAVARAAEAFVAECDRIAGPTDMPSTYPMEQALAALEALP